MVMARLELKRMSTGHGLLKDSASISTRCGGVTRLDAGLGDQAESGAAFLEGVDQREGNILLAGQTALDRVTDVSSRVGVDERAGKGAERRQLAFAAHALGVLHYHAQHAIDLVVWSGKRTVGEGVVGFFAISAALKNEAKSFIPRSLSRFHDSLDARSNFGPDLVPYFRRRLAEGPGMFFSQGDAGIRVVVEHGQIGSPGHPHWEARSDQDANRCFEAVGPAGHMSQRSCCPVVGTDQLAHLGGLNCARVSARLGRVSLHRVLSAFINPTRSHQRRSFRKGRRVGSAVLDSKGSLDSEGSVCH